VYKNQISICRRQKIYPRISPCTKINSNWIKYFNVRSEKLKVPEENIGTAFHDKGTSILSLKRTPITQDIRARNNYTSEVLV
jgi:hypothetical protein